MTEDEQAVATRIGEALARLRKAEHLTQQRFAELVGVDRTYVAYLERAQRMPSFGLLARFARVLGVDVSEFFTDPSEEDHLEQLLVSSFRRLDDHMRSRAVDMLILLKRDYGDDGATAIKRTRHSRTVVAAANAERVAARVASRMPSAGAEVESPVRLQRAASAKKKSKVGVREKAITRR